MGAMRPDFWTLPLGDLTREEWEALCDGCGKCCLHKLEDEETGEVFSTNVACKLLDRRSGRCTDYRNRRAFVPDCVRLTSFNVEALDWLPRTCAYRLRSHDEPLPAWHPLMSGSPETVHEAGESVRGWTVAEQDVACLEHHMIDREL